MSITKKTRNRLWLALACGCLALYVGLVFGLGLGNPWKCFGATQLRAFLPAAVLFGMAADALRLLQVRREETAKAVGAPAVVPAEAAAEVEAAQEAAPVREEPTAEEKEAPAHVAADPSALGPDACWERAREIRHNVIPNAREDGEYLTLVYAAAEGGHVGALAKLGEYAWRREAFVEAYFWTKMARRRQEIANRWQMETLLEIDDQLSAIRKGWVLAGRDQEYRNTYGAFTRVRGDLGRAFLNMDLGIEVERTRQRVKGLAADGNADAALFVVADDG